jgi:PAS domain S-box-containing protein
VRGTAAAATIELDWEGRIASWSDAAREMFGRTAGAVLHQPLACIVDARQRCACENVISHLCRAASGGVHTMELLASRADGSEFHLECSIFPSGAIDQPAGGFQVLLRDIDDRVRVEEDLREQLRQLRQDSIGQLHELRRARSLFMDIADIIDEVFWMADPSITRTLYVSPGYERVWGRTCQSLYDDPRSFIEAVHPDDRDRVQHALTLERRGLPFEHEYRIVRPDNTTAWVWDRGFPVRNAAGAVDRYIGVAQDITSRKAAETALRRQETLDAIGQMAGGLAHDFNNILGVVVGHLDLIGLGLPADSPVRASLDGALDAALRGSRLATRLLALARREPIERRVIGLAGAVRGLRPLLQHAAGPETAVTIEVRSDPRVSVDPAELDAALINLALNARAAMTNGGQLTVTIGDVRLAADASEYSLEPGCYASLEVSDTGCGMSDDVLARLGEPFFTTRAGSEGNGLGVSMIHAFVRQSRGAMRVRSEVGVGSSFVILLPMARAGSDTLPLDGEPDRSRDAADDSAVPA